MIVTTFFTEMIKQTPFWVWVVLVILIKRGLALNSDGEASLGKSVIVPVIFIIWGIEKIFNGFEYVLSSFIIYGLLLGIGAFVGYLLYSSTQKYYLRDGVMMRKGSLVPLYVILSNFVIKYGLNVAMSVNTSLLNNLAFNVGYSIVAGFTVGLFAGGFINTLLNQKKLMK